MLRRPLVRVLMAVLLGACTPGPTVVAQGGTAAGGPPSRDELTAGTRLKVRAIVGADGSRHQVSFYDSLRQENCSYVAAADGTQRCFPLYDATYGGGYFADAECTLPLFYASGCGAPNRKYGFLETASCRYEFHSLSSALTPPVQAFVLASGTCTQTTAPPNYTFYKSTGVLPPDTFVEGSYVIEP